MLYNILIYPSSIKSVLDKIIPLNLDTSQYELELKYRSNKIELYDLISYLKSLKIFEVLTTNDTVYSYNKEGKTFRKIVSVDNKVQYMYKERINNADITLRHSYNKQIDYRLSLSLETDTNNKNYEEQLVDHIRKRERTSFTFKDSFRVDLSDITTTLIDGKNVNRKSYEVEIEFR